MDDNKEIFRPYKPENPVDEKTRKQELQQMRDAAKKASQAMKDEEAEDDEPISKEEAEKQIQDAVRRVQKKRK